MNGKKALMPAPPEFDKLVWKCPCCLQDRSDKFIKVMTHDVSALHGHAPGVMFINCKYCADMPGCKEKAFNRDWVLKTFLPGRFNDQPKTDI